MSSFDKATLIAPVKALLEATPKQDNNSSPPTIQETRKGLQEATSLKEPFIPSNVEHKRQDIPVGGEPSSVPVDVYRLKSAANKSNLPVLVYFPGGGWSVAAIDGQHRLAAELAAKVECVVFVVNYSLSPEVEFPVALYQCYDVLKYISDPQNASELKVDPSRIAIGGDSAGGNLTAAVSLLEKQRRGQTDELKNTIKYQVMYYPVTDTSFNTESYKLFEDGYFLTAGMMALFINNYVPNEKDRDNILISPNRATTEELAGLPPALLITAEADPLRDGKYYCYMQYKGEAYAAKLRRAGVDCVAVRMSGVVHAYPTLPVIADASESQRTVDLTVASLCKAFSQNL